MQPLNRPSTVNASAAWGIPLFYAVAVLARTVVIVIIPTLAFRPFDNASLVSGIYFIPSLGRLLASLLLPVISWARSSSLRSPKLSGLWLIRRLSRTT